MPTEGKKKSSKTHTIKSGKGKTDVTKKSVKDAKSKSGTFKEKPAYRGKVMKDSKGNTYGVKTHNGKFYRATDKTSRRKAKARLDYDRRVHKKDSIAHSKTIKRFAKAKPKG